MEVGELGSSGEGGAHACWVGGGSGLPGGGGVQAYWEKVLTRQ
jgi:hypothetical protein